MSYRPTLTRTWWLKNTAFKVYMLRELTVLPLLFFLLCLVKGLYSLSQGAEAWYLWLAVMQNPLVMLINTLALLASLFHAWTFFQLFPRVMPLEFGGKKVSAPALVAGQWAGVLAVFALVAWLFWG
ncbi:fumarate reductase [Marinospirillum insulare]|uniref:Fumarate reductase subunit C n=1 Tax=Marinospirillum insulare TaxID=217169 RepID=A0ABQ6A4V0_9GAMM|nr:fumarate reductase [Marinospirillum insulare]GLR65223.1 fumarate reductase subunit C [Marinospirillum insulare]